MGPVQLFMGHPGPPELPKMHIFVYCGPYLKNWQLFFFPLLYICLLCDEVLLPWNFRSPGFNIRAPQDPPNMKKKVYFCHILGLNLKISYQIVSLFDMYIDMGERIAGKQDRPSLIIEDPLRAP